MLDAKNYSSTNISFTDVEKISLKKLIQATLREQLLPAEQKNNTLIFTLPSNGNILRVENIVLGLMNRCLQFSKIALIKPDGFEQETTSLVDLLRILSAELSNETNHAEWLNLALEITDHLRNALLSQQHGIDFNQKIAEEAKQKNYHSLVEWLQNNEMLADKTLFFEQFIPQGHPFHPCSKTKFGFAEEDVMQFSPEFFPEVQLVVAAAHKKYMHIEAMHHQQDYISWFAQSYPTTWGQWQKSLKASDLNQDDYLPLPIHPWQAAKIIPQLFKQEIADKKIVVFPEVAIYVTPTLSFRTLAPTIDKTGAYIKLPVAVQATSVFRTLAPASTENTPKISRLLQEIFNRENNFSGQLNFLAEIYGLHLKNAPSEQGRHLAVIFRENVNAQLKEGETCIVIAAFNEISPISNKPIFIELLETAGITQLSQAVSYFHHYVDLVLGSYLDLYLKYGIGLEGHQQNTLAIFQQGKIVRFIARDLDGIDIDLETLKQRNLVSYFDLSATSFVKSRDNIRKSLIHTVYQSHLGELVLLLANYFKSHENLFWQIVQRVTEERFLQLKDELPPTIWQQEYNAFLCEKWTCKALLRMRLMKEYDPNGLFFEVSNPLAS